MIREGIARIVNGEDLKEQDMMTVMDEIMDGQATPAQIAAFITALRIKEETVEEVSGAARIMKQKATRIDARSSVIVDTCGTGGDGRNTFNISTTAAFVVAAADITVAKHGNRAASSGCGSADVLEALGVDINVGPEVVEECIQEIGIRAIFNMLGPLTNPACATAQLIGVYDARLTEMFAGVLKNLGTKRAFIVHGDDGLDKAVVAGETRVSELKEGLVTTYNIDPIEYFGQTYEGRELIGGDAATNAQIIRDILGGKTGACRDILVLNAALAIVAGEKAKTLRDGIAVAKACIDDGSALKKLETLIGMTRP